MLVEIATLQTHPLIIGKSQAAQISINKRIPSIKVFFFFEGCQKTYPYPQIIFALLSSHSKTSNKWFLNKWISIKLSFLIFFTVQPIEEQAEYWLDFLVYLYWVFQLHSTLIYSYPQGSKNPVNWKKNWHKITMSSFLYVTKVSKISGAVENKAGSQSSSIYSIVWFRQQRILFQYM